MISKYSITFKIARMETVNHSSESCTMLCCHGNIPSSVCSCNVYECVSVYIINKLNYVPMYMFHQSLMYINIMNESAFFSPSLVRSRPTCRTTMNQGQWARR